MKYKIKYEARGGLTPCSRGSYSGVKTPSGVLITSKVSHF